jgi:hypothetical protein
MPSVPGEGNIVLQGMLTDPDVLAIQGMGGVPVTSERDASQKEFFHPNTLRGVAAEKLSITENALSPNTTVVGRLRGPGNFGVFRSASASLTGWRLRIFTDPDRTQQVAEFEG